MMTHALLLDLLSAAPIHPQAPHRKLHKDRRRRWSIASACELLVHDGLLPVSSADPATFRPMRLCSFLLLLLPWLCAAQDRRVVITIDDLPCAGCPEGEWERVNEAILHALQEHAAPAIGFVNEGSLYHDGVLDSSRVRILHRWLDAGMELGNHTFAHLGATKHDLVAYEQDIRAGEQLLRPLVEGRGGQLRYFRHPYLQAGPTEGYRDSLDALITDLGYTTAPVTIDNDEYIYAACYADAIRHGDTAMAARRILQYLDHMLGHTRFYEQQSEAFLQRAIPQVLLLHANTLNAEALPELLQRYKERGYRFITLEEALRDPCYALPSAVTAYGFSWIRRWRLAAGQRPPWPAEIEPEVQQQYDALKH